MNTLSTPSAVNNPTEDETDRMTRQIPNSPNMNLEPMKHTDRTR